MAGFDLNASLAASSSATSGNRLGDIGRHGDINIGSGAGSSGLPPWLPLALAGLLLVGLVVWFVRR